MTFDGAAAGAADGCCGTVDRPGDCVGAGFCAGGFGAGAANIDPMADLYDAVSSVPLTVCFCLSASITSIA